MFYTEKKLLILNDIYIENIGFLKKITSSTHSKFPNLESHNRESKKLESHVKFRIVKFQIFKFQNCLRFHAYFKPIVKTLQKLSCSQLWRAQTFTYVIIGYCIGLRQNFIWWELVLTVIFTKKCKNCFVFNWFVWYKYDIYVEEQEEYTYTIKTVIRLFSKSLI